MDLLSPKEGEIRSNKKPSERLPSPILDRLLQDPYHLQRRVSSETAFPHGDFSVEAVC